MSKELTLMRVESEIATGDLGKARDRLHGLSRTYPDDLSLRSRLAEIYWKLQFPHMAGCYWFLEDNQTDDTRQAVAVFEKRCGGDPWIMLHFIKFKGHPDSVGPFAKQRLDDLIFRCKKMHGSYPDFRSQHTQYVKTAKQKWSIILFPIGCISILILIGICAIVGLIAIVEWLI